MKSLVLVGVLLAGTPSFAQEVRTVSLRMTPPATTEERVVIPAMIAIVRCTPAAAFSIDNAAQHLPLPADASSGEEHDRRAALRGDTVNAAVIAARDSGLCEYRNPELFRR